MNENAESRSTRSEHQSKHTEVVGAWVAMGLLLAVWILAYAFAVNGLIISDGGFHEADIATGWQQFGAPMEIDVAKQR